MYVVGQRAQHPILRRYKAKCREEKEQCFTTCQKPAQKKYSHEAVTALG